MHVEKFGGRLTTSHGSDVVTEYTKAGSLPPSLSKDKTLGIGSIHHRCFRLNTLWSMDKCFSLLNLGITDGHMTVRSGQMFSVMLTSDVST